jgi:hypothetical protein
MGHSARLRAGGRGLSPPREALQRSQLSDPTTVIDRARFATVDTMLKDPVAAEKSAEDIDRHLAGRYRTTL